MQPGNSPSQRSCDRVTPPLQLAAPLAVTYATMHAPGVCSHPDVAGQMPLRELCRALAARMSDAALVVRWPDQTPAATVLSVRACAAF